MPMSDLCSASPVSISRTASLRQAALLMRNSHVGSIVVLDADGGSRRPVGMLTDRDIVLKGVVEDRDPGKTRVEDIMSTELVFVSRNVGLYEAVRKMRQNNVRRLIVTDEAGGLCGLFSTDDLVRLIGEEIGEVGELFARQSRTEIPAPAGASVRKTA